MNIRNVLVPTIFTCVISFFLLAPTPSRARDADYERLAASLDSLAADPKLGTLAPVQMDRARAALLALKDAGRSERPYMIYAVSYTHLTLPTILLV